MTIGSRNVPNSTYWGRLTNNNGTYDWRPIGPKLTATWNGADGTNNYVKQVMMVPRDSYIKSVRTSTGSVVLRTVYRPPKRIVKRVKIRKYRPPNAFTNDYRRWYYGIYYVYAGTRTNQTVWQLSTMGNIPSFSAYSIDANDQLALISKLSERIQDTDFSAAIALAEIDKTTKMIADRAKNLARSVAYLRKGNFREALRVISGYDRPDYLKKSKRELEKLGRSTIGLTTQHTSAVVGARILEVQYGWKPLMQDMHEGAVWLAALQSKPNQMRYSVRKRRRVAATSSGAGIWSSTPETESRRQIIAYLTESSFAPTLNMWNVAEVLWERSPYSFLADWVLPIGSYLAARGVASKLTGTFVTTDTYKKRSNWGVVNSPVGSVEYTKTRYFVNVAGLSSCWSEEFVTRSVSSSLAVPKPVFKGLGQIASWQHCVNAVALLAVAFQLKPDDVLRKAGRL